MLKIKQSVRDAMIRLAKAESPIEACGYLAGIDGEARLLIPMTNVDHSPEHFSFAPEEQFNALKQARNAGLRLNAVFHSHPATPARMSAEDIRLAHDPDMVYIIVSLMEAEPVIRGYRMEGRQPVEIMLEITEDA